MATFFPQFDESERLKPTDPNVRPVDVPRLSAQCQAILDLLRDGPRTNTELVEVAMKYTSRISDLRKAGYDIRAIERRSNGVTVYQLVEKGVRDASDKA